MTLLIRVTAFTSVFEASCRSAIYFDTGDDHGRLGGRHTVARRHRAELKRCWRLFRLDDFASAAFAARDSVRGIASPFSAHRSNTGEILISLGARSRRTVTSRDLGSLARSPHQLTVSPLDGLPIGRRHLSDRSERRTICARELRETVGRLVRKEFEVVDASKTDSRFGAPYAFSSTRRGP